MANKLVNLFSKTFPRKWYHHPLLFTSKTCRTSSTSEVRFILSPTLTMHVQNFRKHSTISFLCMEESSTSSWARAARCEAKHTLRFTMWLKLQTPCGYFSHFQFAKSQWYFSICLLILCDFCIRWKGANEVENSV